VTEFIAAFIAIRGLWTLLADVYGCFLDQPNQMNLFIEANFLAA